MALNRLDKIERIKLFGYKVRTLGKSLVESRCICATKGGTEYRGSVNKVYNAVLANRAK